MKALLPLLLFVALAASAQTSYTGSTPADPVVRMFLGINATDSVDFIRWNLTLHETEYHLDCNYGISKPGTNGFINGGEKVSIKSSWTKTNHTLQLTNGTQLLRMAEWNSNLLHVLDAHNNLLVGNGGWSYTLNNKKPLPDSNIITQSATLVTWKDSVRFIGRTPCGIPGLAVSTQCYKLKWLLVMYADTKTQGPLSYKIVGSAWRHKPITGSWKMVESNGQVFIQLFDENKKPLVHLVKLSDDVLAFTDSSKHLLVGDLDFSYTLNRD